VTGPLQLNRVRRKIGLAGVADSAALAVSAGDGQAAGTSGWAGRQVFGGFIETVLDRPEAGRVGTALGELACPAEPAFDYTRQKMSTDLVCVEDTLLASLSQLGTDIVARVQLETATKTVAHGPFYSEHLPPETVLAAVLAGEPRHLDRLYTLLDGKPLQLGGDETVGKGLLWCRVHTAEELRGVLGRAADPGEPAPAPARPNPPGAARPTPAVLARRNRG
jgi:CRISPR-associated protein Cmr4